MNRVTAILPSLRQLRSVAPAMGLLVCLTSCGSGTALRPFTMDGCSCFPDGSLRQPNAWHHACVIHDMDYWRGGTFQERREADRKLRDGVAASGFPRTSRWMYAGVRLGGGPWWPSAFRWGYGWPWGRGYRPLSEAEAAQAAALLRGAPSLIH